MDDVTLLERSNPRSIHFDPVGRRLMMDASVGRRVDSHEQARQIVQDDLLMICDDVTDLQWNNKIPTPWLQGLIDDVDLTELPGGQHQLTLAFWDEELCRLVITCADIHILTTRRPRSPRKPA